MDNINISFAADKSADNEKRLNDIENFISLLVDRIKFCLADINDDVAAKSDGEEEKKLIYQALSDGVGEFTNADKNCEIFNDYENNVAEAYYSHAEGHKTTASAPYSHAEGRETTAANTQAHAEGYNTSATGQSSHAENEGCVASGSNSHAEGYYTRAYGEHSHASGNHTVAGGEVFALGSYNKTTEDAWLVVGNGWGNAEGDYEYRSDALVLDRAGNLHISGRFIADGGVDGVGYTLPAATRYTLGGVMIGDNLLVSESGIIAADLSECVKSGEIADWAKQAEKPVYTAEEVGAAAKKHTHTKSDITDFPTLGTAAGKNADYFATAGHTHTAGEIGAAEKKHSHSVSDITDMPTKLPANGGNADTVDGKHASDFAAAGHTHTAADVGAATAADITAAVNAVSIGGSNLLQNTNNMALYARSRTVTVAVDNEGYSVATAAKTDALGWYGFSTKPNIRYSKVRNAQVTISFEYRSDEWISSTDGQNYPVVVLATTNVSETDNNRERYVSIYNSAVPKPTTEWQKYTKTVTVTDNVFTVGTENITDDSWFFVQVWNHSANNLQIRKLKLEKGNKSTDWSPAPEDAERRITALEARVAALEAAAVSGGEV